MSTADSVFEVQEQMGYQTARRRPQCQNCTSAREGHALGPAWWCDRGDFPTTAQAVCREHEPKRVQS